MNPDWTVDMDPAGAGRVMHHRSPRFTAAWVSGEDQQPAGEVLCWRSLGSSADDCILIFAVRWNDPAPPDLGPLMEEAVSVIDDWITRHL